MELKRRRVRTGLIAAGVTAAALIAPAASQAAVTVGQVNPTQPVGGGSCDPNILYTQKSTDGDVRGTTPAGVITSWATKATDTPGQKAALKTVRPNGLGFAVVFTSQVESLTPSKLNRFNTRIPVDEGRRIGYFFDASGGGDDSQACVYTVGPNQDQTAAGASNGQPGNGFANDTDGSSQKLLNLEVTVETDSDGDGFGDETQDKCLGQGGTSSGCPAGTDPTNPGGGGTDTKKPSLTGLSFSRTVFRAAGSGGAFSSQKKKRKRARVGTKVSFRLSEAASVKFTVQRKTSGRRSSGKCRKRTRKNSRKPKCTLWKSVRGSFTVKAKSGKNSFTFRGRIGGRKLRTGSYRLSGTAKDPAKNASVPKRKRFRIVR